MGGWVSDDKWIHSIRCGDTLKLLLLFHFGLSKCTVDGVKGGKLNEGEHDLTCKEGAAATVQT